jgi:copper(I)-binding protein
MTTIRFLVAFLLFAVLPATVQARAGDMLDFDGAWIRSAPPGSPVMAGYVAIHNQGSTEMLVDSARSDAFGAIEIHEMRDVNGVMRMRPLPELRIEPGLQVELAPGGKHLMLFRPQRELAAGDTVEIEFSLRDGTQRRVTFEVRAATP